MGLVAMHGKLNEILFEELLAGKRFVLIVDEAQNLDDTVLETVRMLSNFETHNTKLLQIILAGQPQLATKLAQPQLSQLRQRVAVLGRLEPFTVGGNGTLHRAPAQSSGSFAANQFLTQLRSARLPGRAKAFQEISTTSVTTRFFCPIPAGI